MTPLPHRLPQYLFPIQFPSREGYFNVGLGDGKELSVEKLGDVKQLNGTLDVLVAEDSVHVAHITSTSDERFKGAFVTLRSVAEASRLGLGLSLVSIGLGVLFAEGHLLGDEITDVQNEIEELVKGNQFAADDIPF